MCSDNRNHKVETNELKRVANTQATHSYCTQKPAPLSSFQVSRARSAVQELLHGIGVKMKFDVSEFVQSFLKRNMFSQKQSSEEIYRTELA